MTTTNARLTPREAELAHALRATRLRLLVLWRSTLRMEIRLQHLKSRLIGVQREIHRLMPEDLPVDALCRKRSVERPSKLPKALAGGGRPLRRKGFVM